MKSFEDILDMASKGFTASFTSYLSAINSCSFSFYFHARGWKGLRHAPYSFAFSEEKERDDEDSALETMSVPTCRVLGMVLVVPLSVRMSWLWVAAPVVEMDWAWMPLTMVAEVAASGSLPVAEPNVR